MVKRTLKINYICSVKNGLKSYFGLKMRKLTLFICLLTAILFAQGNGFTSKSGSQNAGFRYEIVGDSLAGMWSENLIINADPRIDTLMQINKEECDRKGGIEGYRVQIYQGNKETAYQNKSRFIQKYEKIKVYVLFQSPDFKVRVGNFRTRSEALKVMHLIQNDFPATFVVEDMVMPDLEPIISQ